MSELGGFSFSYRSLGVQGMGVSSSSNFAVLYEASQLCLRDGPPLLLEKVARQALQFERRFAGGRALAANDVYPITYGGMMDVRTQPDRTGPDGKTVPGEVATAPLAHDPHWIADRMVIAFDPCGAKHYVLGLLDSLYGHPKRCAFVAQINKLADRASQAIEQQDIAKLADQVNIYRELFNEWMESKYVTNVRGIAGDLEDELRDCVAGWKPPGAGASKSIIVIIRDQKDREQVLECRDRVIAFFHKRDWWATPVYVTSGICAEFIRPHGEVRITAGHRLDFIGGADLGQDLSMGVPGVCCSCAIEPRAEIVFTVQKPKSTS